MKEIYKVLGCQGRHQVTDRRREVLRKKIRRSTGNIRLQFWLIKRCNETHVYACPYEIVGMINTLYNYIF